jgi:iron complex outermembrane receptor protein
MSKHHWLRWLLAASFALPIAAAAQDAPTAPAADDVEVIIVTSRKREESVQDVPFAVSAKTGDDLRAAGSSNIEEIARIVPSLSVQNLGPGQSQVAMRGISAGQIVRDQPGVKEQVGIYLDESVVSLSLFTPDLDLFDLNRVEVLRGPQGTLFGSGSVSGTVRYITNQPNLEEVDAALEAGINFIPDGGRGGDLKGMINYPVIENVLGLRVAAYWTAFPGFIDALTPSGKDHDVNDGDRYGVRLALTWQPTDSLRITPRVTYQDVSVDGMNREDRWNILANPFTTTQTPRTIGKREQFRQLEERFEDEFLLVDLTAQWDITDTITLTSVTSYTDRDVLMLRDATQLTGSITGQAGVLTPTGFPASVYQLDAPLDDSTDVEVITQELRAAGEAGPVNWVAGFFYSDIERRYGQSLFVDGFEVETAAAGTFINTEDALAGTDILFFSDIPYDFKQWALFGEATWSITAQLHGTVGLRYYDFEEDRKLNFGGVFASLTINQPGGAKSDGVNPRFILSYTPTEEVELSVQAAKGFRLAGVNDPLNLPICSPADAATFGGFDTWDDEEVWNYEVGAKTQFADGRMTANAAVFYSDIENLQATVDAGTCSSRIVFNVPKARAIGAEIELSAQPTENLDFSVSMNYVDAELRSTVTSTPIGGPPVVVGGIKKGNRLPTVPKVQFAASATYTTPTIWNDLDGFFTLSYQHIGKRFTQTGDQDPSFLNPVNLITSVGNPTVSTLSFDPEMDAYDLGNLRMGVRNEKWELAFYVNNLWDTRAELALDRERGGRARVGFLTNQPRTIGFTTRINY